MADEHESDQDRVEPPGADRTALAAQALAKAKADAVARGGRPAGPADTNFSARKIGEGFDLAAGGQSGRRRPRRDDPAPLNAAIGGLVADAGWDLAVATGSVFGRWAEIVGPDVAEHTKPEKLVDGELTVTADSTAWAYQLRTWFAAELVRKLNVELGHGTVKRVKVYAPGAGTRQPGRWSVKGSRGPRDTYG
jgi:hypothetical protein